MPSLDLIISFLFMSLLFVRQMFILKEPNKIDYAPLVIAVGVSSFLLHFILSDSKDILEITKESFFPLLLSVLFFIVMNILHQTRKSLYAKSKDEFGTFMLSQLDELRIFMSDLEARMIKSSQADRVAQDAIMQKFKEDLNVLTTISKTQSDFFKQFEDIKMHNKEIAQELEHFINIQLPKLDDVIHGHIDIFRISEQDHFNKIKTLIENKEAQTQKNENYLDLSKNIKEIKSQLTSIKETQNEISTNIVKNTVKQFVGVVKKFEQYSSVLKTHSDSLFTSLNKSEDKLLEIQKHSTQIKDTILSYDIKELKDINTKFYELYTITNGLVGEVESIKLDYIKSQSQLTFLAKELKQSQEENMKTIKEEITQLIEQSLKKIEKESVTINEDITKNMQLLAKKAQIKTGYSQ